MADRQEIAPLGWVVLRRRHLRATITAMINMRGVALTWTMDPIVVLGLIVRRLIIERTIPGLIARRPIFARIIQGPIALT